MKKLLLFFLFPILLSAQVVVTDDITSDTFWSNDTEYLLDGLIFVDSLSTLTIEAGTVIKAKQKENITTGDGASALVVRRGAKLFANGTKDMPIIFTSELDDVTNPNDLTYLDKQLWGGVIVLGRAVTNQPTTENQIEGIPPALNAKYGGNNDNDDSGVLRYISIRHGGFSISGEPGDEINGLTLGAVGSQTTIENIEVFANFDDGYEWFGGTVNTRWLIAAFCGDDAFDYDQGFRGKGQFWFSIQASEEAGRGGEHDGGDDDETGTPYATPAIVNATYIGAGADAVNVGGEGNDRALYFRDNAGGKYWNSIFTDFTGYGVTIEDLASGEDSRSRMENGDLLLSNNFWYGFGAGNDLNSIANNVDYVIAHLGDNANKVQDPMLRGISRAENGQLDPRPMYSSPAASGAYNANLVDPFFFPTGYYGAFDPSNELWVKDWTALDSYGFIGDISGGTIPEVVITDDITENTTWSNDKVYILDGLVFVDSLATLSILPGTVIKAKQKENITTGDGASALVVRRGAKLLASGTAEEPIIFTSELDDVSDPNDLTYLDKQLWGGVIVLGKAVTNQPTTENQIEGIPPALNAKYGGNDDNDNSGVLRYISIRHGGFSISGEPGDEINGLTLGAVGSQTIIEHIEVFANFDDGYEWFGGTVNTRYLAAVFCGDDAFDYDQGFRGKGQFWFSIQASEEAGRGGEHDGGDDDETGTPYATPAIVNATYIGAGADAVNVGGEGNDRALYFRDNAGGKYWNSIFTDFTGYGVTIEDLASGEDSRSRMENGDLLLSNNFWYGFGAGNDLNSIANNVDYVIAHLGDNANKVQDPMLRGISRAENGQLDPRPLYNSSATSGATNANAVDPFFVPTGYYGAFNPMEENWLNGWSAVSEYGFLGDLSGGTLAEEVITADITSNTTWSNDKVYVLDGLVFVDSLVTLTIEPGTVIKGKQKENITTGDGASALIVRRGAMLMAEGTPEMPIIFTSELDDVNDPSDLTYLDKQLWGGVILLGKAVTNQPTTENQIEGIPPALNAKYGGNDDNDNSGVLKFVSIRHGGFSISGEPGDEINGLTLGAVGSSTIIENIEVYANFDDGYEWFGGTVNTRYLVAAFCGDDAFDYDQGFRGKGQFWFSIQASEEAGRGGEHDGGDDDETGLPYAIPQITNATYIGAGAYSVNVGGEGNDRSLYFRDNAGGKYWSSIFYDFTGYGVTVEDLASGEDSRSRMENGDLLLSNNFWYGYGAGNNLSEIGNNVDFVISHLAANGNKVEDPKLRNVSRDADGMFDPRPMPTSPASAGAIQPNDNWFKKVSYYGAFAPNGRMWTEGWTALSMVGHTVTTSVKEIKNDVVTPTEYNLSQNYPNPFNPSTRIEYTVPTEGLVKLAVYNLLGQQVAELVNEVKVVGQYTITWDASELSSGIYFYTLEAGNNVITKKMTLLK